MRKVLAIIFLLSLSAFAQSGLPLLGSTWSGASAGGPVTVDSNSPVHTTASTAAGAHTVNLTISSGCATPTLVVVIPVQDAGLPADVTAVSYNGTSFLSNVIFDSAANSGQRVAAYYLINPTHDGAAHPLSYTLAAATGTGSHLGAVAWCGANATSPINMTQSGTAVIPSGTPVTKSVTPSVSGNGYMVEGVWSGGQTGTIGDSATTILSDTTSGTGSGYESSLTTSADTATIAIGSGGSLATIGVVVVTQ